MMNDDYWKIEPRFMNLSVCLRVSGSLMKPGETRVGPNEGRDPPRNQNRNRKVKT